MLGRTAITKYAASVLEKEGEMGFSVGILSLSS